MDVIILGIYNSRDREKLNEAVNLTDRLEIVWEYDSYNIEAFEGIKTLEEFYKLSQTGILVERDRDETFSSFPIICEVSDSYIDNNQYPVLFQFFDNLKNVRIEKMIIAFADEWKKSTLVKVEKGEFKTLKKRLNNLFVWCESYRNLTDNIEIRDDFHPLVLEIE